MSGNDPKPNISEVPYKKPASDQCLVEAVKGMLDLVCQEKCTSVLVEARLANGDKRSFSISAK